MERDSSSVAVAGGRLSGGRVIERVAEEGERGVKKKERKGKK